MPCASVTVVCIGSDALVMVLGLGDGGVHWPCVRWVVPWPCALVMPYGCGRAFGGQH